MITFGGPQCIVDKSIKKIIAEVRPLFCWRCQHFGNKRSSNPSLRVLRIRKGKFLVKNCSLAHIASVHNCLLCCQHLFEFLGFPRLGSLGFPPLSGLPGLPGLPTPSISAGLPKWAGLPLLDYPQDCPPQDCPLVGNSEVGNPEYTSHQDCPPQLLCCLCIFCEWYGHWVNAGDLDCEFHYNNSKEKNL